MELKWKLYSTHYNYKEKGSIYNINFREGKENHPKKKGTKCGFSFSLVAHQMREENPRKPPKI